MGAEIGQGIHIERTFRAIGRGALRRRRAWRRVRQLAPDSLRGVAVNLKVAVILVEAPVVDILAFVVVVVIIGIGSGVFSVRAFGIGSRVFSVCVFGIGSQVFPV